MSGTEKTRDGDGQDQTLDLDRRSFLGTVGGGLAVACAAGGVETATASGQAPAGKELWSDRGARPPKQVAAWLYVARDGSVTVYSGKIEMGQNVRTSLAQAVADELRVPFERVRMVMGDTTQTPFDIGTFASLSNSAHMPLLRRAAATARRELVETAAREWTVPVADLVARAGRVEHPASGRSAGYGELTRGGEIVQTIPDDAAVTPAAEWTVAGTSVPKVDGRSFVTGAHRYAADLKRPGLWHGKILRPPSWGATRVSVDTTAAEAMAGVVVVKGDIMGVAAADEATAARALKAVKATWKPTPPTCSDAGLAEHLLAHASGRPPRREPPALPEGHVRLQRTYSAAFIAHVALEPRCALAEWEGDRLTVWTSTQRPFAVRTDAARRFGIPEGHVRVVVPDVGSGYGSKHTTECDLEAATLAKAAGRPVRVQYTREEEFLHGYFRPAGVVEATASARADGTLASWEFHTYNAGPPGMNTPYDVPNPVAVAHAAEAPLRQGAYRALASTFNHFARESLMDELAHELKMDPLAFRLKNSKDPRLNAVLKAAAEKFGWDGRAPGPNRGVGIAGCHDKGSCLATCAEVAVDPSDGRVRVTRVVAAFEPGAVVNPDGLTNQVQGAHMMGLGGALFEAVRFENGVVKNGRLSRYRVPRFADLPAIEVVLIDRKDVAPAGAGEIPIVAIAPAVASAVFQATGRRLRSLPLAPEGVKPA